MLLGPVWLLASFAVFAQLGIWVPDHTIMQEKYEGMVLVDQPSSVPQMVMLSSDDPSVVSLPQSVLIKPYSNHGIFEFNTQGPGDARLFASLDGNISFGHTLVHPSNKIASLLFVLAANKTKADKILGYVIAADHRGSPILVKKDTPVVLSSTPTISTSGEIVIKNGTHYADFVATVRGTGKIFASADGFRSAQAEIIKVQDNITLKVAVAPHIVLENSVTYFFVWLEKDGKPVKLPYVLNAFISSNDLDVARFDQNPRNKNFVTKISVVDGVGVGKIFSGYKGVAVITANVEGVGSAQAQLQVGPLSKNQESATPQDRASQINYNKPNIVLAWLYPSVTDSKVFGVIAAYNVNSTKTAHDVDFNSVSSFERITPVPMDGRPVILTSTGLEQPDLVLLSDSSNKFTPSHALEFKTYGKNPGNYTLYVSGNDLMRFSTNVEIDSPYSESYKFQITPIPAIPQLNQDICMISVLDSDGAIVDIQKVFGKPLELTINSNFQYNKLIGDKNSLVLTDTLSQLREFTVSSKLVPSSNFALAPFKAAEAIKLDAPAVVHIGEEFPIAVHEVDTQENPVRKIDFVSMSGTPGILLSQSRPLISQVGKESLVVLSKYGADKKEILSFANKMLLDISTSGDTNKVNSSFELKAKTSVDGTDFEITSPFPYKKINADTFLITPDKEGVYNITVSATKLGYLPATNFIQIQPQKIATIQIFSYGSDKKELHTNVEIQTQENTITRIAPYVQHLKPQFVSFEFPAELKVGGNGYRLQYVQFDDQNISKSSIDSVYVDGDHKIYAKYARMVLVEAENANGGGIYPYGETVILSVPPKDRLSVFVRDVFDRWEGIPYNSETVKFIATNNVYAKAHLRQDYSFLMLSFGMAVSFLAYFKYARKKGLDLVWYFRRFLQFVKILLRVFKNVKNQRLQNSRYSTDF